MTDIEKLIQQLLEPNRVSAPYPEGYYEVVDPIKQRAVNVILQQQETIETLKHALTLMFQIADGVPMSGIEYSKRMDTAREALKGLDDD